MGRKATTETSGRLQRDSLFSEIYGKEGTRERSEEKSDADDDGEKAMMETDWRWQRGEWGGGRPLFFKDLWEGNHLREIGGGSQTPMRMGRKAIAETGGRWQQREGGKEKHEDERGQANQMDSEKQNQKFPNVGRRRFQRNCDALFHFFRFLMSNLLYFTGIIGFYWLWMRAIEMKKLQKIHVRARQIMIELLQHQAEWDFGNAGRNPDKKRSDWLRLSPEAVDVRRAATSFPTEESKGPLEDKQLAPSNGGPVGDWPESPILLAAKNGIEELVEYVLDRFPQALFDLDSNGKNIILLAVEHRQSNIFELMLKRKEMKQSVFAIADKEGNSAAHLAAKLRPNQHRSTLGAALRMQWEVKWFKYVERSVDPEFFPRYNDKGETAQEIFVETHKDLLEESVSWLTETFKSYSVVAALIAPMAFVAITSLPTWGVGQHSSSSHERVIAASVGAVYFSLASVFLFLPFLARRYEPWDFETHLPFKLMVRLICLYWSVVMTVACFAARYSLLTKEAAYLHYFGALMLLLAFLFSVPLVPLKLDRVPERALPASGKPYVR
ncbi:uncharacterized protein [Elaeis guineensis]|uniref:uncharacterized protein n=1 Tax=Elaeis guineensis var. tenera TaxID=51953 RepID=UPI003C6CEAF5